MSLHAWKRRSAFWCAAGFVGLGFLFWSAAPARAGAKVEIKDGAYLDLGFRIQVLSLLSQTDSNGDGSWDSVVDHRVRRARFRGKMVVSPLVEAFLQTETGSGGGDTGRDMRVIESYVQVNADPWARLIFGQTMAPACRQNLTSTGGLLALERPGVSYHTLNFGNRSTYRFTTSTLPGSSAGIPSGDDASRDLGITLFGAGAIGDNASLKYYLGTYNGVQAAGETAERVTARAQVNFFDPEDGYYCNATYLGAKKTVGVGASIDVQPSVYALPAAGAGEQPEATLVDYMLFSVDGFVEWPVGEHTLTAEAAVLLPDLDDQIEKAQGVGAYVQAGLLIRKVWQPWAEFETFASDADDDTGSYRAMRVGIARYLLGHNAKIQLGVESLSADTPIAEGTDGEEDSALTVVLGVFTNY